MVLMRLHYNEWSRGFWLFAILFVASLVAFPIIALSFASNLPNQLSNFLFFWPQVTTLPSGFQLGEDASEWYLEPHARYIAALFWFFAGIAYGFLTRKISTVVAILTAYPAMFVLMLLTWLILGSFGISPYLDGP